MKIRYGYNTVEILDDKVVLQHGISQTIIKREAIVGVTHNMLSAKTNFVTSGKSYGIHIGHRYKKIIQELGL